MMIDLRSHSVGLKRARIALLPALGKFLHDDEGQDLVEYALLLAAIALAGTAAFLGMSTSTNTLWSIANSNLAAGNAGS